MPQEKRQKKMHQKRTQMSQECVQIENFVQITIDKIDRKSR